MLDGTQTKLFDLKLCRIHGQETSAYPACAAAPIFKIDSSEPASPSATDAAQSLHCNFQSNSSRLDTRSRKRKVFSGHHGSTSNTFPSSLPNISQRLFRKFRSFCIVYRQWVHLSAGKTHLHFTSVCNSNRATLDNSSIAHRNVSGCKDLNVPVNLASSGMTLLTVPA